MLKRFSALFTAFVLLSVTFTASIANPRENSFKRAKSNQLVAMLPASDGVVAVDVKRFFNEALPTVLSSNQPMLADWMAKVAMIQDKTGIDIKQFDHLVAGMTIKSAANKKFEVEPVMVARGNVDTAAIIASAKAAAANRYKEESVNGRTMYVLSIKEVADKAGVQISDEKKAEAMAKYSNFLDKDIAVSAVDANTLAFGYATRVRELLAGKTKIGSDVANLLNRKEFATVNFATKVPTGLGAFIPLDNDELGKSVDSIKYAFGSMDSSAGQTSMNITARTEKITQAQELHDTLDVLQTFGKMALGGSKRPDQQLYARLIDKVQFTRSGTEITMNVVMPQSDIDQLMAILTKSK